ncbi:MAG: response regulator transcription factor [Ginsengibacter sp.]
MMKIRIGIIDDHQLFSKSLTLMLQSLDNYEVIIEASNGKDLQEKIANLGNHQLPEIMLIDVNMPVMGGIETAEWVNLKYPSIKLVALSQNDSEKTIIGMIKAGCCAYLLKDTHPNELEKALNEIHSKGFYNADASNINFRRLLEYERDALKITDREKIFLQLACSDKTYKQIASEMHLSERTIDGYRESLFQKLNVQSRVGMALEAIRRELVTL